MVARWGLFWLATVLAGCGADDFTDGHSGSSGGGGPGTSSASGSTTGSGAAGGGSLACESDQVCAPDAPSDWAGPVIVYVGVDPAPAACDAPWVTAFSAGLGKLDATLECVPCSCGAPTGVACSTPTVTGYQNSTCTMSPDTQTLVDGTCVEIYAGSGAIGSPMTTSGGACAPSGGDATKPDPTWEKHALVCEGAPQGEACEGGHCLAVPAAPFGATACLYRDGDQQCPAGFTARTLAYRDVVDTRACSRCGCGSPSGASCAAAISVYDSPTCNLAPLGTLTADGTCQTGFYILGMKFDAAAAGGTCTQSGGEKQGDVQPAAPVTICCAPG